MGKITADQPSSGRPTDDRYFSTRHQYLAAYLFAHDHILVNVDRDDQGLICFVFLNTPEREDLVEEFRYGPEALVDARKFVPAIHKLQRLAEKAYRETYPPIP
jgi:hypothetical protein